jgi:hypothetical protein
VEENKMPWTKDDAKKHKKGLTSAQEEKWAATANGVLHECMSKGKPESECAASAIRIANSQVGAHAEVLKVHNANYIIRREQVRGKSYIIVPVVMMVEGVHHGSRGPLLHLAEDLGRFPEVWNGIPVVIDHPVDNEGNFMSANSPDITSVGQTYHSRMVDTKLMADAYLDEELLRNTSPVALSSVLNGDPLEVSIGVFTDEEETQGIWNNEQYNAIARNHRPDHLALLPGGIGACSWNDGCGIRANSEKQKGGENSMENDVQDNIFQAHQSAKKSGLQDSFMVYTDNEGVIEKLDILRRKVDSLDSENTLHYLQEVYERHVVYEVKMRQGGSKFFKQEYAINDGQANFVGNPEQVKRKVEYIPITHVVRNLNNKGGSKMDNNKECGQCMEKIVAIIQSNATPFTEADREWLLTKDEAFLNNLLPKTEPVVNKKEEKPVEVTKEMIINAMSDEDKAALAYGKKQLTERRNRMIKGIQDNSGKETWTDAVLATMSEDMLERVYNSVKKEEEEIVDHSVLGGGFKPNFGNNSSEIEPLPPAGIELETKK